MDNKPTTTNDTHSIPSPSSKSAQSSHRKSVPPTTISWITERDILRELGDRRTRAVLAILTARRSSGCLEFFVPPHIATLFRLSPKDLCWALKDMDGTLLRTVGSTKGKFRKIRLLPEWENQVEAEKKHTATQAAPPENRNHGTEPSISTDPDIDATLKVLARLQSCDRQAGPQLT